MINLTIAMILLFPFVLTFSAYILTNGLNLNSDNQIDDLENLELVHI